MSRFANQFVVSILIFSLSAYSNKLFAQPGKQEGHYNYDIDKNSLTANAGVGLFCGHIGAGGGLEYQRFIDQGRHLSIDLKAAIFTSGTTGEADYGDTRINIKARYIAPGARYHITGNAQALDFSVGIFVPVGSLTRRERYIGYGNINRDVTTAGLMSGIVSQFVLDIRSRSGFTIGPFINVGALFTEFRATNGSRVQPLCFSLGLRIGGYW